jgi:hypothetical protein
MDRFVPRDDAQVEELDAVMASEARQSRAAAVTRIVCHCERSAAIQSGGRYKDRLSLRAKRGNPQGLSFGVYWAENCW